MQKEYFFTKMQARLLSYITVFVFNCVLMVLETQAQEKVVSCVGNSITYGYGLPNPSTDSYPGQMQLVLGKNKWNVKNFGASGRTMLKNSGYSYWNDQSYTNALASNPNVVVIDLGTNDAKRWLWDTRGNEFETDYQEMVQSFYQLPTNPSLWAILLIPGENSEWDIYDTYIRNQVNPAIKKVALENGVGIIDLYGLFKTIRPELYLSDKVHPSIEGTKLMASEVGKILQMPKPQIVYTNKKVSVQKGYGYQWYINNKPVATEFGGTQQEMVVSTPGIYKVAIRIQQDNETYIISEELLLVFRHNKVYRKKYKKLF